jgi:long-chain acyl-CoA synthetase
VNRPDSLAAVLGDTAARRPEHPALIFDGEPVTYRELWRRARRCAAMLAGHGVGRGDAVALLLPNTPRFPAAYYGALSLGAVVVPIDVRLRSEEIEFVLRDAGVRVLIHDAAAPGLGAGAAAAAGTPTIAVGGPDQYPDAGPAPAPEPEPAPADWVPRAPDDVAAILYTSGTTGRPKGVMLTHGNILGNIETTAVSPFAVRSDDRLLLCLPLSHTFGQTCGMGAFFRTGATIVLMPRFEAETVLREMAEHRCTVFMGVPTMYHGMLQAAARGVPAPRLRRVYSGGAALPVPVLDRVRGLLGCEVYEGYGLTETSPVVAYNLPGRPCRPGTVGLPIEGVRVGVARADLEGAIDLLPAGAVGEIVVRGPNLMAGYHGLPGESAAAVVEGWFRTGDLGVLDGDGYLSIVDRKKDMIIRGGNNVSPREVEEVLLRHPDVAQAAVAGVPDAEYGEQVCAAVVLRARAAGDGGPGGSGATDASTASAEELIAFVRERLAGYKSPGRIRFVASLPLGTGGKVLRREVAGWFRAQDAAPAVTAA